MNRLLIEVNQDDHAFVESVCVNGAYTFSSFFSHLLLLYKKSLNEPLSISEQLDEKKDLEVKTKKNKNKKD